MLTCTFSQKKSTIFTRSETRISKLILLSSHAFARTNKRFLVDVNVCILLHFFSFVRCVCVPFTPVARSNAIYCAAQVFYSICFKSEVFFLRARFHVIYVCCHVCIVCLYYHEYFCQFNSLQFGCCLFLLCMSISVSVRLFNSRPKCQLYTYSARFSFCYVYVHILSLYAR